MKASIQMKKMAAKAAEVMITEGSSLRQIEATGFFVATSVPEGYSCWDEFQHQNQTIFIVWQGEE